LQTSTTFGTWLNASCGGERTGYFTLSDVYALDNYKQMFLLANLANYIKTKKMLDWQGIK
jgi:hypothetical protein